MLYLLLKIMVLTVKDGYIISLPYSVFLYRITYVIEILEVNMNNAPNVKLGIVAVSRDCFP